MSKALVIFLHGIGSKGKDLATLGRHCEPLLPDVIFAAPDASFPHSAGFEWFSFDGVTPENRPARVRTARDFRRYAEALLAQHRMMEDA